MSFITKRERVFNEYDLFDLPARNEGKLKAYSSCTDARAWSHFCSDQTEHLVDLIKRNNAKCRTKYVPTDVIVNTLMVAKNAEIGRLKRRIEEFEQMLAAYDQLDLTSEQKVEIANAHAAIKAANKELDELCLDLDLSGFTEGVDSEAFETGKSRGDEPGRIRTDEIDRLRTDETGKYRGDDSEKYQGDDDWIYEKQSTPMTADKSNQIKLYSPRDASTNIHDPRIQQMQDTIIGKDAKLNAMQNTIAVMENDVCEPYCIYAHIYTALEKIFGILCQNNKYKLYLNLMTAGNDTRCVDIKGKILFKLKVLEKFSLALIAPCSQEASPRSPDCSCYRAEINQRVESTFALTCSESEFPCLDNKRAHLVADIMENEDMKEILRKENKIDEKQSRDNMSVENYDIETENLKRLKNLQANYDDLVTCYENLKHDKDNLIVKCQRYEELENEYEILRTKLREYNLLWNEKEHYRKRSGDLDSLKEKFMILTDETTNLETQLKAESEINHVKTNTIEELRSENISLNKKYNDTIIAFEKEKNLSQCKLKESECKVMCQEQQIKSLSLQIDRLLEQDKIQVHEDPAQSIFLIDEIESLKDQIKNLKNALYCNEDEKHTLHEEYQEKLKDINELRMAVEDWKSIYEKLQQRNNYLENFVQNNEDKLDRLIQENRRLSQELEEKTMDMYNKAQEIRKLIDEVECTKNENDKLLRQLYDYQQVFDANIDSIENEKKQALQSLDLAKQESRELLTKVKDYDDLAQKQDTMLKSYEAQINELQNAFLKTMDENKNLQMTIKTRENNDSILLKEIEKFGEVNYEYTLRDEEKQHKFPPQLTRKESKILEIFENVSQELLFSRSSHKKLYLEKEKLELELGEKTLELADATQFARVSKKESQSLSTQLLQLENLKQDLLKTNVAYKNLSNDNQILQNQLTSKNKELTDLLQSLDNIKKDNYNLMEKSDQLVGLEQTYNDLQKAYNKLLDEKSLCEQDLDNRMDEISHLNSTLERKIQENIDLRSLIKYLENNQAVFENKLLDLQNENLSAQTTSDNLEIKNAKLIDKIKQYETVHKDFEELRRAYDQSTTDKERLQHELDVRLTELRKMELENNELHRDSQTLIRHSESLEKLISKPDASHDPYSTIKKEIVNMKQEKVINQSRIRELSDKLDESDNIISDLKKDIIDRDGKIAILQNHINELEIEVKLLHEDLVETLEAGEGIKQENYEKIDKSLKNVEAHHSRATHNMKMELAKLQNEKSILEDHLSLTKLKSEESATEKYKYISQIKELQNEKEIIVTDIKQLELESVGSSNLSQNNCTVKEILLSLDRIRKLLEVKNSKCNMLEQNLLKVQTSSQLLVNEAKGIVEKEKQKILSEKEEAIRDKVNMQKQLEDQKVRLENQISIDSGIIKDLEAELLNQKLLFEKINKTNQIYVSKLEEELRSLENLYKNSMVKISELQEKLLRSSEELTQQRAIVEKTNLDLEQKSKEIKELLNNLDEFKNKPRQSFGIQTSASSIKTNSASQTDKDLKVSEHIMSPQIYKNNFMYQEINPNLGSAKSENPVNDINISDVLPEQKPYSVNEVQILTANIEPSHDFIRNSYLKYKLQQLSTGRLEQYSILNVDFIDENNDRQHSGSNTLKIDNIPYTPIETPNLIDIYNRQSLHSNSSKAVYKTTTNEDGRKTPTKSSLFTALDLTTDSFITNTTTNKYKHGSSSGKMPDKDFFVIYKDSESNSLDKRRNDDVLYNTSKQSEAEFVTAHSPKKISNVKANSNKEEKNNQQNDIYYEEEDTDSVKPKLHINLPRVVTDSISLDTSECDRNSLDSYSMGIDALGNKIAISDANLSQNINKIGAQDKPSLPTLLNDENVFKERQYTTKSLKTSQYEDKIGTSKVQRKTPIEINVKKNKQSTNKKNKRAYTEPSENESHYKLSRDESDVFVIKREMSNDKIMNYKDQKGNLPQDYGLQYILNTVQRELEPEINAPRILRKIKSDEENNQLNAQYIGSSSNPSSLSTLDCKMDSSYDHTASKTSDNSKIKSYVERGVMVQIDNTQDYEAKINYMTKALENIEKEYKNKIEVIKIQYDNNVKSIINQHNQGVQNIQNLHEETLQDILKVHENQVENLTSLSMEAMRKSDKLEKENRSLKSKMQVCSCSYFSEEPSKMVTTELKKRKKSRIDTTLTKTNVDAFNVKPKSRSHGPCTCSLDVNISDTIRNIFEQVDVEQRKMAEHAYMKYIVEKMVTKNVEALDTQELSFLHLKVCRTWKMKMNKEESIQKGIGALEHEVMNKQRNAQQYIAELDREVTEQRRRLQEAREAVCRSPTETNCVNPNPEMRPGETSKSKTDLICKYNTNHGLDLSERQSAGDLLQPDLSTEGVRPRRIRTEINRAVLARPDMAERREKKLYNDEPPTRLRRGHATGSERVHNRTHKK